MRHILVMGICGTGKSTVAGLLADRMARPLVEADTYHSQDAVAAMSRTLRTRGSTRSWARGDGGSASDQPVRLPHV